MDNLGLVAVGVAQFLAAIVLAYFTRTLSDSTKNYSNQVEKQTTIMEENIELAKDQAKTDIKKLKLTKDQVDIDYKKLEQEISLLRYKRLRDEMDKLIAPLYFAALEVNDNLEVLWRFELVSPGVREKKGESKDYYAF